ncbi:hypothetical protein [Paenibacillus fonticola]|uniref:hypothetical protein n=1 Tax=Paenibacillus fonticola TaxID=379896 RepID=UPI00039CBDAF|nr:hypothetical protein [Paenibacillus fonticola]
MGLNVNRWVSVVGMAVLLLVLSGCNFMMDPKSLMKTPELSSDKETLRSVINTELKGAEIRPRDADDISSIRVVDLNKDGIMEAVVFYETPLEKVKIHGLILENQNDTWVPKVRFDGEGQVLESFELKDVTGNGQINIVAGFSSGDKQLQKGLIVYSYTGSSVERLLELPYNYYVIDDLNADDQLDITVVSLKKDQFTTITTYQYDQASFQELDKLQLDDAVTGYYNVVHGDITPDQRGIILDAVSGELSGYSIMIGMEDGKLVDFIPDRSSTLKDYQIMSGDVNDDGILEIGMLETPKGWEYIAFNDIPWLFSYYKWEPDKGLTFVMQQYMDLAGRFYFNLPKEWWGKVTIDIKSIKDEHIKFVDIDTNATLAEIRFFSLAQWEQVQENWELFARDNDKVIGFLSHTDLKVNKGEKEIKR